MESVGSIEITAFNSILVDGKSDGGKPSGIFSSVQKGGIGNAGILNIDTDSLTITNGAIIIASTLDRGDGGEIEINANSLSLFNDGGIISRSETNFEAGDVFINVADSIQMTDSIISTSSFQSSGGNLTVIAGNIELRGNSDLTTNVFSREGTGGSINISANSVLAFDDSDIFAFAGDGEGGNITLNTNAFFAENFTLNSLTANPDELDLNNRPDLNATGAISGAVLIPDQSSLSELENDSIDTDELVANSCVAPTG